MRLLLSAGFGEPLDADDQRLISALGFDGIRSDYGPGVLQSLVGSSLRANVVIVNQVDLLPDVLREALVCGLLDTGTPLIFELGNELDLARVDPRVYARDTRTAYVRAHEIDPRVWCLTAGIGNLSRASLGWLEDVLDAGIPEQIDVAFHTYRDPGEGPQTAHKGFASRNEEFLALLDVAKGRPIWNTESGWSLAAWKRKKSFFRTERGRFSGQQVAEFLEEECRLNRLAGAQSFCVYQWNDGPRDTTLDRYGIRDFSGNLRPAAASIKTWRT